MFYTLGIRQIGMGKNSGIGSLICWGIQIWKCKNFIACNPSNHVSFIAWSNSNNLAEKFEKYFYYFISKINVQTIMAVSTDHWW